MHITEMPLVPQFATRSSVRRWPVYEVSLASCRDSEGQEFRYLIGSGACRILGIDDLEAELFNGALQSVDATDESALIRFASTYGLIPSPCLDGVTSLARFRLRNASHPPVHAQAPERWQLFADVCTRALNNPKALRDSLPASWRDGSPREQSEIARAHEWNSREAREVISLAEMAQAIRALQCATVIPMVYSYFASSEENSLHNAIAYLENGRYFQQAGPKYFFFETGSGDISFKLTTFKRFLDEDPRIREAAMKAQVDAKATFYASLAVEFPIMAQAALDYLSAADREYRGGSAARATESERSGNPFEIPRHRTQVLSSAENVMGTLGEAVVSQYARVFSSPALFRRCEHCGKIFKKYKEEKFDKNIRATRFCKKSCGVLYNQKNRL